MFCVQHPLGGDCTAATSLTIKISPPLIVYGNSNSLGV